MEKICIVVRHIIISLSLFISVSLGAQNYESRGDEAFSKGDYSEAELQYNAALAFMASRNISENSPEYLAVMKKIVRSQECVVKRKRLNVLWARAESEKTEIAYVRARNVALEILELNPSDPQALSVKSAYDDRVAAEKRRVEAERRERAKAAELKAEQERLQARKAAVIALKSRNMEKWDAYVASIPKKQTEEIMVANDIRRYFTNGIQEVYPDSVAMYNRMGDWCKEVGLRTEAEDLYDCSASLGDPEGLYKKSEVVLNKKLSEFYLLLAAESGYAPAKEKLDSTYTVEFYDKSAFDNFRKYLNSYRESRDTSMLLYFAINQHHGILKNEMFKHVKAMDPRQVFLEMSKEELKTWIITYALQKKDDPWLECFFTMGVKYGLSGDRDLAVKFIEAVRELGYGKALEFFPHGEEIEFLDKDVRNELVKAIEGKDGLGSDYKYQRDGMARALDYIRKGYEIEYFLSGGASTGLFYMLTIGGINTLTAGHECLLLEIQDCVDHQEKVSAFDYKMLNKYFLNMHHHVKVWDADIVSQCIKMCEGVKGSKKLVKWLSELETAEGIYNRSFIDKVRIFLLYDYDVKGEGIVWPKLTGFPAANSFKVEQIYRK